MARKTIYVASLVAVALLASACGGGAMSSYSIAFNAVVAGAPFSCQSSYPNIGTSQTTVQPLDFRLYVHDVQLVRANGEKVPLTLKDDGKWQGQGVALLDFEDGTGTCNTASPETNTTVTGTAAQHDDYTGIQLTLGLPAALDHLDDATAMAPLNVPAMFWGWVGGYRYLKVEMQSPKNPVWHFHLGAMYCQRASGDISCKYDNLSVVTLANFKANASTITLDLASLFADSDLDHQVDGTPDLIPGCMSSPGDPECTVLFSKIGLAFDGGPAPAGQTFFAGP
jgi:uncharacterized repeat protein (TIGR04052 family)